MLQTTKVAETPATSRHTSHSLRLLPSGPDRVHELLLREDQSLHRYTALVLPRCGEIMCHRYDQFKQKK